MDVSSSATNQVPPLASRFHVTNCSYNINPYDWYRLKSRNRYNDDMDDLGKLADGFSQVSSSLGDGAADGIHSAVWKNVKPSLATANQCLQDPFNREAMIQKQLQPWRHHREYTHERGNPQQQQQDASKSSAGHPHHHYHTITHDDIWNAWINRMSHPLLQKQTAYVQIINQQLYMAIPRKRHSHATRCLESFIPWMQYIIAMSSPPLPNTEFILNLYAGEHEADDTLPTFSYCKSRGKHILIPRMYFNERRKWEENSPERLDTWARDYPWEEKENRLVFRGVSTHKSRVKLALESLAYPQLMDIGITQYLDYRLQEWPEYANHPRLKETIKERMSMKQQLRFKYFINLDGVACADRLPMLLVSNSVVLMPESDDHEYWYEHLKPWKHYVPIARDLSDIVEKIEWLRTHDAEARQIATESTRFILEIQDRDEIHCYFMELLREYGTMIEDVPMRPLPFMRRIESCSGDGGV